MILISAIRLLVVKVSVLGLLAISPLPLSASTSDDGRLTLGAGHGCVLRQDRTIACWGRNDHGQAAAPAGTFKYVSAGSYHTCAVRMDGKLACWGHNDYGQSGTLHLTARYQQVTGGGFHTCALSEDTYPLVTCWGRNTEGQTSPPYAGLALAKVSAASWSTCGIQMMSTIPGSDPVYEGPLICWGENNGSIAFPGPGYWYTDLSMGFRNGCARMEYSIPEQNNVHCWGAPHPGGNYGEASAPTGYFLEIATGEFHNCGVRADGTLHCWGNNASGEATPPAGNAFARVATGRGFSCAMRQNDSMICWGRNENWNVRTYALAPVTVPAGTVGVEYSTNVFMSEANPGGPPTGYPAYNQTFRLASGSLPPGLVMEKVHGWPDGILLKGIPTTAGRYTFTLRGREEIGFEASRRYTVNIENVRVTGGHLPPRLVVVPSSGVPQRSLQPMSRPDEPRSKPATNWCFVCWLRHKLIGPVTGTARGYVRETVSAPLILPRKSKPKHPKDTAGMPSPMGQAPSKKGPSANRRAQTSP